MFQAKLRAISFILAAAFVVIVLMLAFRSGQASAATITVSGSPPQVVQVPQCSALTTAANNQKTNIGVICVRIPPPVKTAPAPTAAPAAEAPKK